MKTIRAEITPGSNIILEPLSVKRSWMDNVSNAHAYHCFPVSLANGLGWGISFPEDISFVWDGIDTDKEEGHITILTGHRYVNENRRSATLSLNTNVRFITDENITMLTMPVPNLFPEGIVPYTTLISTSFYPNMLPAAVKITKANSVITIPSKTPVLAVIPISVGEINNTELEVYDFIMTEEEKNKNKTYGEVSQELNQKGEWTNFYRDATDEKRAKIGRHEVKTFRLKTTDKRKHGH
jgi:hypothetical protein